MRNKSLAALICALSSAHCLADDYSNTCAFKACPSGSIIYGLATKSDPSYACMTKEIAQYVNSVYGIVSVQKVMTGTLPNISPQTGEPEYQGKTAQVITGLRVLAKVNTFDEAAAECKLIKYGQKLTVANFTQGADYLWAFGKPGDQLWYPTNAVGPKK